MPRRADSPATTPQRKYDSRWDAALEIRLAEIFARKGDGGVTDGAAMWRLVLMVRRGVYGGYAVNLPVARVYLLIAKDSVPTLRIASFRWWFIFWSVGFHFWSPPRECFGHDSDVSYDLMSPLSIVHVGKQHDDGANYRTSVRVVTDGEDGSLVGR